MKAIFKSKTISIQDFNIRQKTVRGGRIRDRGEMETAKLFLDRYQTLRFVTKAKNKLMMIISYYDNRNENKRQLINLGNINPDWKEFSYGI